MDFGRIVSFKTPAVTMGIGARKEVPGILKSLGKKVFAVVDPQIAEMPAIKEVLSEIPNVKLFTKITPDPSVQVLEECAEAGRAYKADSVLAIGGGSSLDSAKCAAIIIKHRCSVDSMFGTDNTPGRGFPTVLVPTTAGTGSEVTPIAVFSDEKAHLKRGIVSDDLLADFAVIDPELCLTLPPNPTAYTGMDTLTHAIEAYTNKFAVPFIDCLALEAIRLTAENLAVCVENGSDIKARYNMSIASLFGGYCLRSVNTAAVHALAYPLGGGFNVPHGIANSLLLPHVMRFNSPATKEKFSKIAQIFKAEDAISAVANLAKKIGTDRKMREFGVKQEDLPGMAKSAMEVQRLLKNNPREVAEADALSIYEQAW